MNARKRNYKTFDQEGPVYSPVEEATQRDAMNFLNRHAFSSPSWAFNEDILSRVNQANAIDYFRGMQKSVLATVLDPQRIARLIEYERRTDGDVYTAFEMMDDVRNGIFSELRANENIDVHRRNLQRAYLELMESLMKNELPNIPSSFREFYGWTQVDVSESDIRPIVRNELEILRRDMNRRINAGNINRVTRVHLLDAIERIDEILDADD